jgi:hypothetical protein
MIQDPPAVDHRAGPVLAHTLRGGNLTEFLPWRREYYDLRLRDALLRNPKASSTTSVSGLYVSPRMPIAPLPE